VCVRYEERKKEQYVERERKREQYVERERQREQYVERKRVRESKRLLPYGTIGRNVEKKREKETLRP
jgi:hypothetical protein